jgi:hypothetical protein
MLSDNAKQAVDAGLHLFDRQLVDKDGRLSGKVDDLELTFPDDGSAPVVTAILAGPGALAHRMAGRTGRWIESVRWRLARLSGPPRIAFGVVRKIGAQVELAVSRDELDVTTSERWATRIVERIPGAE